MNQLYLSNSLYLQIFLDIHNNDKDK